MPPRPGGPGPPGAVVPSGRLSSVPPGFPRRSPIALTPCSGCGTRAAPRTNPLRPSLTGSAVGSSSGLAHPSAVQVGRLTRWVSDRRRVGPPLPGPWSSGGGSVFENRIASPRRLRKPQSIQMDARKLVGGSDRSRPGSPGRSGACPEQRILLIEAALPGAREGLPGGSGPEEKGTPVQTLHFLIGEFDPGSERTLAACLTHASRARMEQS
jgi:hypothetical protein